MPLTLDAATLVVSVVVEEISRRSSLVQRDRFLLFSSNDGLKKKQT